MCNPYTRGQGQFSTVSGVNIAFGQPRPTESNTWLQGCFKLYTLSREMLFGVWMCSPGWFGTANALHP
jgi:hypothetical protein